MKRHYLWLSFFSFLLLVCGYFSVLGHFKEPQSFQLLTKDLDGNPSDFDDDYSLAKVSGNAHYVVFQSKKGNLVPNDTNNCWDLFLYNTETSNLTRISLSPRGQEALYPDYVVDVDGEQQRFPTCRLGIPRQINSNPFLWESTVRRRHVDINNDGNLIVFDSYAANLVANDTNNCSDIFLYDRKRNRIERISLGANGEEANHCSFHPAISGDGNYIIYSSIATNLGDPAGAQFFDQFLPWQIRYSLQIYLYDLKTKTTRIVSIGFNGFPGLQHSDYPDVSDGGVYNFSTNAGNMVSYQEFIALTLSLVPQRNRGRVFADWPMAKERFSLLIVGKEGANKAIWITRSWSELIDLIGSISGSGRYLTFAAQVPKKFEGEHQPLNPNEIFWEPPPPQEQPPAGQQQPPEGNGQPPSPPPPPPEECRQLFELCQRPDPLPQAQREFCTSLNEQTRAIEPICDEEQIGRHLRDLQQRFDRMCRLFRNLPPEVRNLCPAFERMCQIPDAFTASIFNVVCRSIEPEQAPGAGEGGGGGGAGGEEQPPPVEEPPAIIEERERNLQDLELRNVNDIILYDISQNKGWVLTVDFNQDINSDSGSSRPSISHDGKHVIFDSFASNLLPGAGSLSEDIFLKDLESQESFIIPTMAVGEYGTGRGYGDGGVIPHAISLDGSCVVFSGGASNLLASESLGLNINIEDYQRRKQLYAADCRRKEYGEPKTPPKRLQDEVSKEIKEIMKGGPGFRIDRNRGVIPGGRACPPGNPLCN